MNKILETERLYLRKLREEDCTELMKVLSDPEAMTYYPRPYTESEVREWIKRNIQRYENERHGLWAVIRKYDGAFMGDCGLTMQDIDGEYLPEIGYHIIRDFQGMGYATEAAKACLEIGFSKFGYETIFSYATTDNEPSIRVACKIGMTFHKVYKKGNIDIIVHKSSNYE